MVRQLRQARIITYTKNSNNVYVTRAPCGRRRDVANSAVKSLHPRKLLKVCCTSVGDTLRILFDRLLPRLSSLCSGGLYWPESVYHVRLLGQFPSEGLRNVLDISEVD